MFRTFTYPLFNPVAVEEGREKLLVWDDCFSFPDAPVNHGRLE